MYAIKQYRGTIIVSSLSPHPHLFLSLSHTHTLFSKTPNSSIAVLTLIYRASQLVSRIYLFRRVWLKGLKSECEEYVASRATRVETKPQE